MKKTIAIAFVVMGLAANAMAAEFTGFVMDQSCSKMASMRGNAECAKSCIKRGSPAVLVTDDGKVYKIANQSAILSHAGENVTVDGSLKGDTITVASVK